MVKPHTCLGDSWLTGTSVSSPVSSRHPAYDPLSHPSNGRLRQQHVLNRRVATGVVPVAQAAAFAAPLGLPLRRRGARGSERDRAQEEGPWQPRPASWGPPYWTPVRVAVPRCCPYYGCPKALIQAGGG
jgi:hypothetical protein